MGAGTVIGKCSKAGFTLIELLVVLALVAVLAAVVSPMVSQSVPRAKESALRENLYVLRKTIDDYYADKGKYPLKLEVLEQERYIRNIPLDPITKGEWGLVYSDSQDIKGIIDIHSTSTEIGSDGKIYESW